MRPSARRFRGPLLVLAVLAGAGFSAARGQELQVDSKALDATALDPAAAGAVKGKGKKAKAQQAPQAQQAGKPATGGPNRQFGELEGWSPGKAPPKPADREHGGAPLKGTGLGVSPSGNMSVGLPF